MTISYNEQRKNTKLMDYSSTVKDSPEPEENKMNELTAKMQEAPVFEKPRIEEGLYECECVEVKKIADGKFGPRIAVICSIEGHGDVQLAKVSYMNLTPKSGATEMIMMFGCEFMPGNDFNFNDLVGKKAKALVEDYDAEGKPASTISKFKALK